MALPIDIQLAAKVTEFWNLVDVKGADECWLWTGYIEKGYGQFYLADAMRGAHELAVTFTTGEVRGEGMDTCHSCHNPPCCNPSHLRFDTRAANVADMLKAGRSNFHTAITPDVIQEISERRERGASQKRLAMEYGVSDGYISEIVRGKRRADVGGPIQTKRVYRRTEMGA